jgi:hypothetical protein
MLLKIKVVVENGSPDLGGSVKRRVKAVEFTLMGQPFQAFS